MIENFNSVTHLLAIIPSTFLINALD